MDAHDERRHSQVNLAGVGARGSTASKNTTNLGLGVSSPNQFDWLNLSNIGVWSS